MRCEDCRQRLQRRSSHCEYIERKTMQVQELTAEYAETVFRMMQDFYRSPAVSTDGSDEIFRRDIGLCLEPNPYLRGYVMLLDGTPGGYAMTAQSFSTEYGRLCVWIEDLYVKPDFRSRGLGSAFLSYITGLYPDAVLRLEVDRGNEGAIELYRRCGFTALPYAEFKKLP